MTAQCLSVCGPPPLCGHISSMEHPVCDKCQESYDNYVKSTREIAIARAKTILEANGYVITKSKLEG